jgi:UPF0755 protein
LRRKLIYIALGILASGLIAASFLFGLVFISCVVPADKPAVIYIPRGATYTDVLDSIRSGGLIIKNQGIFDWVAAKKNYPSLVKPGRYVVDGKMNCNDFINMLRSGRQTPVRVTFNNIRTMNDLAGKIGRQIETDSAAIISFLEDPANYSDDGFTRENIMSVFIPDTYELLWSSDPEQFYTRMLREHRRFWNAERKEKAGRINLSETEVSILASIVDEEAVVADEKPRIAGVYINRLKRGIPLQADPTIKFAVNDFTLNRILNQHLLADSPYNTYKYKGLPPGPIRCPSIDGIDAVLNAEKHDYLYFVARADFSGYHNFSRTLTEHNRYADQYRKELNRRKIYK